MLVLLAVPAKNLARSAVGRAFAAVRDRDLAAEVMGVSLTRHKLIAFTISSFYAGIAGALLPTVTGFIEPGSFNLLLSVQFLAMILIGGVATLSGSLLGAAFVILLPRLVEELPRFLPFVTSQSTGGVLTTFQLQTLLYGVLIVVFLIAEPTRAVRPLGAGPQLLESLAVLVLDRRRHPWPASANTGSSPRLAVLALLLTACQGGETGGGGEEAGVKTDLGVTTEPCPRRQRRARTASTSACCRT